MVLKHTLLEDCQIAIHSYRSRSRSLSNLRDQQLISTRSRLARSQKWHQVVLQHHHLQRSPRPKSSLSPNLRHTMGTSETISFVMAMLSSKGPLLKIEQLNTKTRRSNGWRALKSASTRMTSRHGRRRICHRAGRVACICTSRRHTRNMSGMRDGDFICSAQEFDGSNADWDFLTVSLE